MSVSTFSRTVLALIFVLASAPGGYGDPVSDSKASFRSADAALNAVYRELKRDLEEWEFEELKADQIEWLVYRDGRSEVAAIRDGGAEEGKEESNALYWEFMTSITEERVRMLNGWKDKDKYEGWTGEWIDGRDGLLRTVERNGALYFTLHVVRGPTYHIGGIAGKAQINQNLARFTDKDGDDEKPEGEGEAWLDFKLDAPHLEVRGVNTGYYHGARAYFDGTYIRVAPLSKEDAARVVRGELGGDR